MISLGPFLCSFSGNVVHTPEVLPTGYAVEFSGPGLGAVVPVYKCAADEGQPVFKDYLMHSREVPFSLSYHPRYAIETAAGMFIALESLLVCLYLEHQPARPLTEFLAEFRAALPLHRIGPPGRLKNGSALNAKATEMGFNVMDFFSSSRSLTVCLGWICPQDREFPETAPYFSACVVEFRPRPDRTLNAGRWLEPMKGHLNALLRDILRNTTQGPPVNLLSEEGQTALLEAFQWTPLSLLTVKQARKARVEFARNHHDLLDKPKELALALQRAQLYSKFTSVRSILKHLDSIIAEARN